MSYHITIDEQLPADEAKAHYIAHVALEMSTAVIGSIIDTASPYTPTPILFHTPATPLDFNIHNASALGIAMALAYHTGQDDVFTLDITGYLRDDGAVEFEYDIDDYTAHWGAALTTMTNQHGIAAATPISLIVHLYPDDTATPDTQSADQQAFFDPYQLHLPDALSYIQYHAPKILKDSHDIDWRLQHTVVFNHCDVTATP